LFEIELVVDIEAIPTKVSIKFRFLGLRYPDLIIQAGSFANTCAKSCNMKIGHYYGSTSKPVLDEIRVGEAGRRTDSMSIIPVLIAYWEPVRT
jgi:hypothetical protein